MWILHISITNITQCCCWSGVTVGEGIRLFSACDTCKLVSVHCVEINNICARSARSTWPAKSTRGSTFALYATESMLSKHAQRGSDCLYSVRDKLSVDSKSTSCIGAERFNMSLNSFVGVQLKSTSVHWMNGNKWLKVWERRSVGGFFQVESEKF